MPGLVESSDSDLDLMLDILADEYRRRVLLALLEHNPQDDHDPQIPEDVVFESDDLDALLLRMQHGHLPKLEEAGFIEWDREANTVRKGPKFEEVMPLLELIQNHADELPRGWL